jgi:hypothetical protein
MTACWYSDDYLSIVKMLLNHFKIKVNQQDKVIVIIRMSILIILFSFF